MGASDEADVPLGALDPLEIAAYLREIGDEEAARRFEAGSARGMSLIPSLGRDPYAHTGVVVGFVRPGPGMEDEIVGASRIEADAALSGRRVKITLDQFYVQSYPGLGRHRILCEFGGRNQVAGEAEEMKFALTLEARDGQGSGIYGKPLFMGVTVGPDGLGFRGRTVNVRSDLDDMVLEALNGEAFRQGLGLVSMVQPALKPFVGLASSVVKAAMRRRTNKLVFEFDLGLDFTTTGAGARLRKGSYIIIQHDEQEWNWARFAYARDARAVVQRQGGAPLALNYMVIGIDDHHGEVFVEKSAPGRKRASRP